MTEILQTFATVGIHLGISILLCLIAMLFTKSEKPYLLFVFSIFFLATIAILFIPNLPFLDKYNWNWQGKFLSFVLALLFIYFLPYLTKEQAGFTFKINKSVWLPFIILTGISLGWTFMHINTLQEIDDSKEYLFFQLTMPGLSEELIFRGILLGLLNLIFVTKRKILGADLGMGALIQVILFGIGHAIYFDQNQHIQFYMEGFLLSFILGVFMTYLKEKGESIIPAILFHTIYNAALPIARLFI
jgi:membrane protease YdiL (CAAX protease family)